MTYRKRRSSPLPDFSPAASSSAIDTSNFKHHYHHHHHKIDQRNKHDDEEEEEVEVEEVDDYTDASRSQSPYEASEDQEEEEEEEVEEERHDDEPVIDDDLYAQSESVDNEVTASTDQLSTPLPKFQRVRNNALFESPLNSPKFSQPIFNYMNVAPLPIFRGTPDECPMTHLSRFSKVCRANNASSVDMMIKIFPVTLENEASLWYDLNIETYPLTWEEIKSSFTEAYYRNDQHADQFRSELNTINQKGEESVRSYFLRLQLMLTKWPDHGLSDSILKDIFIDGLREDFQDWLIPQRPNSLDEALRLAFDWEQVESIRAARRKKKCGFCDGSHEERVCEVREGLRQLWFKSKEKQLAGVLGLKRSEMISSCDGVVVANKELGRSVSVSVGTSSVAGKKDMGDQDGKEEVGEMLLGGNGKQQKSLCQCGKHQCWKKRLDRNNSFI